MTANDNFSQAKVYPQRASDIVIYHYGAIHAKHGLVLNRVGEMLAKSGDLGGARIKFGEALSVLEQTLGRKHLEVANVLANLGWRKFDLLVAASTCQTQSAELEKKKRLEAGCSSCLINPKMYPPLLSTMFRSMGLGVLYSECKNSKFEFGIGPVYMGITVQKVLKSIAYVAKKGRFTVLAPAAMQPRPSCSLGLSRRLCSRRRSSTMSPPTSM